MWISPQVLTILAIVVLLCIAWWLWRMYRGEVIPMKPGYKAETGTYLLLDLCVVAWLVWTLF